MPRNCIINFNNPVTGRRHASLVGYMLNQNGISEADLSDVLSAGFIYSKSSGVKNWNNKKSESPYVEPNVNEVLERLPFVEADPSIVGYIDKVQSFYDEQNLAISTTLNLSQVRSIIKNKPEDISLEIETVDPEVNPNERTYRIYPLPYSQDHLASLGNSIFNELYDVQVENGLPTALRDLTKFIDLVNPNLYNTINNILKDSSTTPQQRDILNTLLSISQFIPDINFEITKDVLFSENNVYGIGQFDPATNTIVFNAAAISTLSADKFKNILIHEMVHAAFFSVLENPITAADKVFASEVKRIYEYYREKHKGKVGIEDFYGLTDYHEFLSEFLSNPAFRAAIEQEAPEVHGSFIQSMLNFFKKMFNKVLGRSGRSVSQEYIDSLVGTMVRDVISNESINTSLTYSTQRKLSYAPSTAEYEKFLEEMPYTDSKIFFDRLDEFLNSDAVDWSQVYREADRTGVNVYNITAAQEHLNSIVIDDISRADLKTSFSGLVNHLSETIAFLRSVARNMEEIKKNKAISERDFYSKIYHSAKMGEFFVDYVNDFKSFMFPEGNVPFDTLIGKSLNNIEAIAKSLQTNYNNSAAKSIAKRLASELAPQTEVLRKEIQKEVNRLEKLVASADSNVVKQNAQLKLRKERERLNFLATPENLEKALLGSLQIEDEGARQKASNYISSIFESAAISGNLVSGSLGTLINNIWSRSTQKALALEGEMKQIANQLQEYNKKKGKTAYTGLDFQKVFGPFIQKVTVVEIQRGQLVERETLALLNEFDEIGYRNDWTRKKYEINKLESKKNRTDQEETDLEKRIEDLMAFEDLHLRDMYTDEYHRIQGLLLPEARDARSAIIDKMRQIQLTPVQGEQSEEDLDKLDDLKSQLDQLESDYDEYGVLKDDYNRRIAENIRLWKSERAAANMYQYTISESNRALFEGLFESKKAAVAEATDLLTQAQTSNNAENLQIAQKKYQKAISDLEKFKKANVVRKVAPEFYEERRDILDAISEIQDKYPAATTGRTVQQVYEELFSLLKPYKNKNSEYEGSLIIQDKVEYVDGQGKTVKISIPVRIKQLQDELDDIREEISENREISKQDKQALRALYGELSNMQETVETEDYEKQKAINIAKLRPKVIAALEGNVSDYSSEQIRARLEAALKKTDWFKDNHRLAYDFRTEKKVYKPTFQWQVTLPTNPNYILETEPSFRWYNIQVNPVFINPEVKENRNSKRVALKSDSIYRSKEYAKLDDEQRDILRKVTDIYQRQQKGLPKNLMKGLELPSVRKDGLEGANQSFGTIRSQISSVWGNITDSVMGRDDEELGESAMFESSQKKDSQLNRSKNRLYMKYVRPVEADKMTVNFIESITQFGAESIRFKGMYEELPYILGVRDLVEKNVRGTTAKVINDMLERRMNGQNKVAMSNIKALRFAEEAISKSLSLGANMVLSLNLPSAIKNFQAGSANIYIQLNRFGISKKAVSKHMGKNAKEYMNLFNAQVEEGQNTPYMVKMKYFSVMTTDTLSESGKKLYLTSLDKSAKYNPLKHLAFMREFGEFEMRSAVAGALSDQFLIELNDGKFVPIMDAYQVVGNTLVPREDIKDQDGFAKAEQHYRNQLNLVNSMIHGAYGSMDKGEYSRYTFGRLLMYMRGWLGYQYISRFGSRRMSYSAGMQFEGMYRTVFNASRMLLNNKMNFGATRDLLSRNEKENLISAGYDTIAIIAAMAVAKMLASAVYSDDDDDMDNLGVYYMLYNVLYLEDELSSLHPLFGTAAIAYSRLENNVDGKSAVEYYTHKNIVLPFQSVKNVLQSIWDFTLGDINAFDDYVPRSKTGRVLNPKRYQRDPFLDGKPEIVARLAKLWALDKTVNSMYGGQEYLYRRYEYSNPKWYTSSYETDKRSARKGAASAKKEIKSIEQELKYVDDQDTKDALYERISNLQKIIDKADNNMKALEGDFETMDRK